jgi:DNA-binding LacI/PurR family transcriptional regulator
MPSRRRGKPNAIVYSGIAEEIRRQIVSGAFPPGARLPTRKEWRRRFRTTPVTIQKAFDRLIAEEFVVARGRSGTFVADAPPHLRHYGIVFPFRQSASQPWPQFWIALLSLVNAHVRRSKSGLSVFYGNETHTDLDAYLKLIEEVQTHQVAGLLFVTDPFYLKGSPVLEAPGIPRVAVMAAPPHPGVVPLLAGNDLLTRALDFLQARGRHRIAFIMPPLLLATGPFMSDLSRGVASRGMTTFPFWFQATDPLAPASARNIAHLLMSANRQDRPDGLVIMDDNLVPYATAGLVDAGVKVPEEVEVVAHCNFPHPTPSAVPAVRLGCDVRAILASAIDAIDRQRRGEAPPMKIEIPALFEHEVQPVAERRPAPQHGPAHVLA